MRAYRESNVNRGVNILTRIEFNAIPAANRSSDVLYIIGDLVGTTHVDIQDVWVGNVSQNFLVGSDNAIKWVGSVDQSASTPVSITGFTAPVATTGTPINTLI